MKGEAIVDIFCTATEMKEKKRVLYEKAMQSCTDSVGSQTFRMLRDAEQEHMDRIAEIQTALGKGALSSDACRLRVTPAGDTKAFLKRLTAERKKLTKACADDVLAIETGLSLENAAIEYFNKEKDRTKDTGVKEFLEHLIEEDRAHYTLLADLKFYFLDPEAWFMEKGRTGLDGAGAMS